MTEHRQTHITPHIHTHTHTQTHTPTPQTHTHTHTHTDVPTHTSHTRSMVDIQEVAKWQFCRTTQVPSLMPVWIKFMAMGPWPWPRDSEASLFPEKPCMDRASRPELHHTQQDMDKQIRSSSNID